MSRGCAKFFGRRNAEQIKKPFPYSERTTDCKQKAILPRRGRIALSANERIAEFLDFSIQSKFAYVNKPERQLEMGGLFCVG